MKFEQLTSYLESIFPSSYKEDYDNVGLLIGDKNKKLENVLLSLDITEDVLLEAKEKNCNLVISHHPLIFSSIKKINADSYIERCINYCIKNDIALYALHTNLDNSISGINSYLGKLLKLENIQILKKSIDSKLLFTAFIPVNFENTLKETLFHNGIGNIGNYTNCSFSIDGFGSFKPNESAQPYIGNIEKETTVQEKKVEFIISPEMIGTVLRLYKEVHPYEEPIYYIKELRNPAGDKGQGIYGEIKKEIDTKEYLKLIKNKLKLPILKTSKITKQKIGRIGICSGSGSFLIKEAINNGIDLFLTGDLKYHDFFHCHNNITLCDIGHYESEIFFKEIIFKVLSEKFSNIVIYKCKTNTNPIFYN